MEITKDEKAALVGMVLGDGYLQKTGRRNARLRLEHRLDHRTYLEWKTSLLPRLFQGKPTILTRVHPKTHQSYRCVRHQSNASPDLGKLRTLFYPSGKKHIPDRLEKLLISPLTLAIWYMDDGYYYQRDRCAYLYLGKVSRREAEIAQNALMHKFDIRSTVLDKKTKGFALYFPRHEAQKLAALIKSYLVPVMAYKIPS
jgi:hypothetical protein